MLYVSQVPKDDEKYFKTIETKDVEEGKIAEFNFGPAAKYFLRSKQPEEDSKNDGDFQNVYEFSTKERGFQLGDCLVVDGVISGF